MNTTHIETCRQLLSELRWNERHAQQSARIAASKALSLGADKPEVMQLIRTIPSASYLHQHPHIFSEVWESVAQAMQPDQYLTEAERLLAGVY